MKLECLLSHIVDEDDDGHIRTVRNGECAEIIGHFPDKKGGRYHVGVPRNGANGFYNEADLQKFFKRIEPDDFQLANDPPPHKPLRFDDAEPMKQRPLIDGLNCLPGQLDLF